MHLIITNHSLAFHAVSKNFLVVLSSLVFIHFDQWFDLSMLFPDQEFQGYPLVRREVIDGRKVKKCSNFSLPLFNRICSFFASQQWTQLTWIVRRRDLSRYSAKHQLFCNKWIWSIVMLSNKFQFMIPSARQSKIGSIAFSLVI